MPCLLALIAFSFPRLVLAVLFLFTDYTERAFHTALWPLLGFIFMPCATLAYAFAINSNGSVTGFYLALVVLGALLDLGVIGGGHRARRQRAPKQE